MSALLAVQDHPNESMLYFLKALLTIEWESTRVSLGVLSILGAFAQEIYPYKFLGVDANDSLYGGHQQFLSEIDLMATKIYMSCWKLPKILEVSNNIRNRAICVWIFLWK